MMPDQFVPAMPADSEAWGKLVMSWATRKNFVDGSQATFDLPPGAKFSDDTAIKATLAEFNAVAADGASVVFPASVQEVVFVQDTPTRRYVRLPQAEMVMWAFNQLNGGIGHYTLPMFYLIKPLACANPADFDIPARLTLQAERVGDYSISSCM
ncbi:MAG: hypothetical protein ABI369_06435 [Acetobacteraceae bacterium]